MNAPTLYFLNITESYLGGFEIWEQHKCQEKGCFKTEPELVDFKETEDEVRAFIADFENKLLEGKLEDVEWNFKSRLPVIDIEEMNDDFCGTYTDYPEMILAMAELSCLKPYRVIQDGRLKCYTFEVVE